MLKSEILDQLACGNVIAKKTFDLGFATWILNNYQKTQCCFGNRKSTSASSRFVDSIVFSASCKNKEQSLLRRLLWYNLLPEVTNLRRVETTSNAANIKYVSKDLCSVLLVTMRWNQKTERCHTDRNHHQKKANITAQQARFTRNFDFKSKTAT